jgi:hypothetical protein
MFNKRHYEAIAQTIQSIPHFAASLRTAQESTAATFADMLQHDNPRFDRSRFLHACKPGSNVKARTAHLKAV